LIYQDRRVTQNRPPQTVFECARCLAMLRTDANNDTPPTWVWSMEQNERPKTWIQGLVFFLAVLLRPHWKVPFFKHRFLSWKPEQVDDVLACLQCVVAFFRGCQSAPAARNDEVPTAAYRQLQYTTTINRKQAALLRANKLLINVLCFIDRLVEILVLFKLIHAQKNLTKIMGSREWFTEANGLNHFNRLFEIMPYDIMTDAAFVSLSSLCAAFVQEVRSREGYNNATVGELLKLAPVLYEAANRATRTPQKDSSNELYSQLLRKLNGQPCNNQVVELGEKPTLAKGG